MAKKLQPTRKVGDRPAPRRDEPKCPHDCFNGWVFRKVGDREVPAVEWVPGKYGAQKGVASKTATMTVPKLQPWPCSNCQPDFDWPTFNRERDAEAFTAFQSRQRMTGGDYSRQAYLRSLLPSQGRSEISEESSK